MRSRPAASCDSTDCGVVSLHALAAACSCLSLAALKYCHLTLSLLLSALLAKACILHTADISQKTVCQPGYPLSGSPIAHAESNQLLSATVFSPSSSHDGASSLQDVEGPCY